MQIIMINFSILSVLYVNTIQSADCDVIIQIKLC